MGCLALIGVLGGTAIVLLTAVGFGISSGRIPSTEALPQGELPARQVKEISKIIGLRPNEQILFFYSAAMTTSGDGNLFTNERVVSYTKENGPLEVFEADYDQIESSTLNRSTTWLEDSTLEVQPKDGAAFVLWVSAENDRDIEFHEELLRQLQRVRARQDDHPAPGARASVAIGHC